LNDSGDATVFLLWNGYHRDRKIVNNSAFFSSSLAISELKSYLFIKLIGWLVG
jgi:hypothetical protein